MAFKKYLNFSNIFIGLYSIYLILKAKEASSITGILLLIIIIISGGYFLYIQLKVKQPSILKWLSILFYMFAFYGILHIFIDPTIKDSSGEVIRSVDYIKKIAASILPVYPMFIFARKGYLNIRTIYYWIPIFILISIYSYFQFYNQMLVRAMIMGSAAEEFTNNTGYLFVSILPLLFLKHKNSILQYIFISICAVFIVAAVKRGAILIGGISIFYFMLSAVIRSSKKARFKIITLLIIAIFICGYYIVDYISNSDYFSYRLNNTLDGNMSGRDEIYGGIWDAFCRSGFFQILFGSGADSSIFYTGLLAHNDWLEILINQGLLGIVIFLLYNISLFRTWLKYRKNAEIGLCFSALFLFLFLRTFFSMSYTEYSLYTCIAFGYCASYISFNNRNVSRT